MKNVLFVLALLVGTNVYGQKEIAWFDAGIKAMYGAGGLLNSAVIDDNALDYELGFGNAYSIGGKFGINRGYNGLAIELMYSQADQVWENADEFPTNPEVNWKSLDLYLLFRNAKNLGFFEIGPKVGFLRGIERTGADGILAEIDENAINATQLSGVLSFGVNVIGTDGAFSGQLGLRFEYGFTDIIDQDFNTSNNAFEPLPYRQDLDREKSAPIFAGLVFELNWGIGYYGIAKCGGRAKFFNF